MSCENMLRENELSDSAAQLLDMNTIRMWGLALACAHREGCGGGCCRMAKQYSLKEYRASGLEKYDLKILKEMGVE